MGRTTLPPHVRAMIPAAERSAPKSTRQLAQNRKLQASPDRALDQTDGRSSQLERLLAVAIALTGLPTPEREYRFHPTRRWRIDFAWPAHRLAVEVEGGIYRGGAHTSVTGLKRDIEKGNAITMAGYRLLRFHGDQIKSGEAVRLIAQALGVTP